MFIYMGVKNLGHSKIQATHILSFLQKGGGVYQISGDAEKAGYSTPTSVLCHI